MITDEGSLPEMGIWSIMLIKSDLKWCEHHSRSLFLYFIYLVSVTASGPVSLYAFQINALNHSFTQTIQTHCRQNPGHHLNQLNGFMLLNEYIIRQKRNIYTIPLKY